MKRIAFFVAALCGLCLAQAAPPLRNLSVEMRVADTQFDTQRGAQGSVSITSRDRRIDAGGAVTVHAGSTRQTDDSAQRVLVLNGGRATLRLAQGLPLESTEVWWTPWGPGAVVRSQWVELVNGMEVRPLWPGGDAAVTVELAAQSVARNTGRATAQPPGQALPEQAAVLTTVQVPLGEWVEVARVGARSAGSSMSSGGFGAATASREHSLQLRVSLP
jgi:hypothetical protein